MGRMFGGRGASVNEHGGRRSTIAQGLTTLRTLAQASVRGGSRLLAATLLPPICCLCGAPGGAGPLDLCEVCRETLPSVSASHQEHPPIFARVVVPFRYAYPVDHLIRALKFRGERAYGRVLGILLAEARREVMAPLPQLVVPVPLHASRYRERGFNQANEIARFACRQLGLQLSSRCLMRVTNTREQSTLQLTERIANVRGAFAVKRDLSADHVALVDDVLTTGNTAAEAARALKDAGVKDIELWTAARVTLD